VVKLGRREEVADDYHGWAKCVLGRPFSSRIFVHVSMRDLGNDRAAIIYQDAYQLYAEDTDAHSPQPLETVVSWAIHDDKPDPRSVERVIRQVYADLYRWFYRSPRADAGLAARFYGRRLGRALEPWRDDPTRVELRRDLVWLICGQDAPDAAECPQYIDPYDYVRWVLDQNQMPQTLVGMSHGDVHGRNILVGVQRGEAEYPSVFDYSEMGDSNVLVWDFVKLETELKVRLLMPLFEDQDARQKLLAPRGRAKRWKNLARRSQPSVHVDPRSLRAEQLAFAFELEWHMAALTNRIFETAEPDSPDPPGGPEITGDQKLDRAMRILLRIRQEAAYWLGARQRQRGRRSLWRDEYYFGLAVYGLSTAKWDYAGFETGFALVSAGVAAAQVTSTRKSIRAKLTAGQAPPPPYPCYRVPLRHAHRLWKGGKNDQALALLTGAIQQFGYAVPLLQEYAWMLATGGQHDRALDLLKPLSDLCRVFGDCETLSRFGRIFKDLGDRALEKNPVSFDQLSSKHPASQWYRSAYERYKEASDVADPNEKYYPEINAATMALLRKMAPEMKHSAQKALELCAELDLGDLSPDDRFWVLVTEGEASLLMNETQAALRFYAQALSNLGPDQAGMGQAAYDQVCRLWWALGEDIVGPVAEVFEGSPIWTHLEPGPLGNCG
jgi:tetratricopeptide (TPR) repeat protein